MEKVKLKPCPFCGEKAEMTKSEKDNFKACCANLRCIGSYVYLRHPTEEEAAAAWNRRMSSESK